MNKTLTIKPLPWIDLGKTLDVQIYSELNVQMCESLFTMIFKICRSIFFLLLEVHF